MNGPSVPMVRPRRRALPALLAAAGVAVGVAACANAGADRGVGLDATGSVHGVVTFDANGSRVADAGDTPVAGAGVRLLAPVSRDTVLRATTDATGRFRFDAVPVGDYLLVIDDASAGDSAVVVGMATEAVRVLPGDSLEVPGTIGFPLVTTAEARALPPGTRVFIEGVALNGRLTFSDSLLHVADPAGALRATRVRPSAVAAGDSVRLRGLIATRLGQPALDDVTVFLLTPTFLPPASTLTTAVAAAAAGGTLDAALVRVMDAEVLDTATVAGNLRMTMDDGSGPLIVELDRAADGAFRAPYPPGLWEAPNRFDVLGVLVPDGLGGWRLRPRAVFDLVRR